MLYLKKLFLYNWHYISRPLTLEFDKTVSFITGTNAAGKSTVLDAIKTVMFCKTTGYNLSNTLAGERSGRNLLGYIRAETESGGFKRKGAVTTHLAAEMCYENGQTAFTLGCTFSITDDSVSSDRINKRWWKIDAPISSVPFVKEGSRIAQWEDIAKAGLPGLRDYQTNESARDAFSRFLGLTKSVDGDGAKVRAVNRIIDKMIAFNPKEMKNIDEVLKRHVFEEKEINVTSLLETLDEQTNLQSDVHDLECRLDLLAKMVKKDDLYRESEKEEKKAAVMYLLASGERKQEDIKRKKKALEEKQGTINALMLEKADREARKNALDDLIASIKAKSSDGALEREIEKAKEKIDASSAAKKSIKRSADDLFSLVEAASQAGFLELLDMETAEMLSDAERIPEYGDYKLSQDFISSSLQPMRKEVDEKKAALLGEVNALTEKERALRQEIESLRRNTYRPAGRNADILLGAIREAAGERGKEIVYLHEKLTCSSEDWQQAIESALGGARFHIWVPADLYETAADVTGALRKKGADIHGAVILDTRDLVSRKVPENSICTILSSEDEEVVKYLAFAFGNIVMEEDASRVPPESRYTHIDRNLICHAKRRLSVMKKEPCIIGEEAKKKLLEKKEGELSEVLSAKSLARRKTAQSEELLDAAFTYMKNIPGEGAYREAVLYETYSQTYKDLIHKRDTLLTKSEKEQLQESERERTSILERLKQIDEERSTADREFGNMKALIESDEEEIKGIEEKLSAYEKDPSFEAGREEYKKQRKNYAPVTIRFQAEKAQTNAFNQKTALDGDIRSLQRDYCRAYARSDKEGAMSMPVYRREYERIEGIELPVIRQKLERALENSRIQFKKTVLSSWKESLRKCRRQINEINSILIKTPYIGRYYRLGKLKASEGMEDVYRAIINAREENGIMNLAELDDDNFNMSAEEGDKADAILDDLITSLLKATASDIDAKKWLDYRKYIRFSFEMTEDPEGGKWTSVEDSLPVNSGGELQVPFYLIFCSALVNIYGMSRKSGNDCIRLMMLDEAFDHMDGPNTAKAVELFSKHLGLQLIFCAPSERYEQMGESVRMVILMKGDKKRKVRTGENFSYEECAELLEQSA